MAILILIGHFVLPFALLLSARLKRSRKWLPRVALWLLGIDLIYVYWLVMPAFYPGHFHVSWLDIVTPLTIGGLWLTVFLTWLKRRALLPVNDAALNQPASSLQEAAGHG